ncbi:MAG: ribosome assembly factor SBDS [Methanobrevibacter sp.]|jgi:ribosome maturation protein SDO1|nr:ribosome assembly factor SBDS [Candidatus Methanovirga basalitermitum]
MVNVDDAVVARLEFHGERFEILVDSDLAADFRNPNSSNVGIENILAVEEIFKDAKKGDKASEEVMGKIFQTKDVVEVAKEILKKGSIQLTAQQKRKMQEEKRLLIINKIARESINPQNGLPHPINRIENAMNESKIHIDPFKPLDEQIKTVLKAIKIKIPISFEKVKIAVHLPGDVVGSGYSVISKFGQILNEEWQKDGSWIAIVQIPGGLQDNFASQMEKISGGNSETKLIK